MLAVVLIFICMACGILLWWRRNPNKDEPPAYSGSLPLIGHAHHIVGDSIKLWNFLKNVSHESLKTGGAVSFLVGPKVFYVVTNPEDCLKIANTCLKKNYFYEFTKPWLGNGLATVSKIPVWKTHRKLLNPAFGPAVLYGFLDVFNLLSRRLVKDLEVEVGKEPFDHWIYTRNNALETICLTSLGLDIREKQELCNEYSDAIADILSIFVDRIQNFWFHFSFIYGWSALKRKQDACVKILHNMSYFLLKQRKANYLNITKMQNENTTKGPIFKPFLDLLLKLSIEESALNGQEVREHLDTIIFGGHDTSASVIMYNMLLVGSHPHVQEKIFEELSNVFDDADRDVTKQDLSQLVYLEAVLKETMRFYPVAPTVTRYIDRDIKLKNWTLSKGRTCLLSIYGIHRHPIWGPDAEQFKPERWLDPETLPDFPNVFAAFSLGKRNCIGQAYAIMSMKINLVHLYRHYRVSGDHTKLVNKMEMLLKPVSGHYVAIEKRNK